MAPDELSYASLTKTLAPFAAKGRTESASFLDWFLQSIYRLDEITAVDCICDKPNDKGVDGVFVDNTRDEVHILQCKIRQSDKKGIGDAALKPLVGTLSQFETADSVKKILEGGASEDLKNLLRRQNIMTLIEKGYQVRGVYISNEFLDANGEEFIKHNPDLIIYDRHRIASEFIDVDTEGGVEGKFSFNVEYVEPIVFNIGDVATAYVALVEARDLVKMSGIEDGSLFSQNVRQSLGNTKVNRALRESVKDSGEHQKFPLYHNGVTILCREASCDEGRLEIEDYVVVNGAQSISTFYREQDQLTGDLRVLAKVIKLQSDPLSKQITVNSNNQNAIKPRDLKSNNAIQIRLQKEFDDCFDDVQYEIKRGESHDGTKHIITNEDAGRLLLAYDLKEPYSCHQVYKLFDDKYSDIFGRPEVNAYRIVFLENLAESVSEGCNEIEYKPLSKYGLTKYFLMFVLREIIEQDEIGIELHRNPKMLFDKQELRDKFDEVIEDILETVIVDLNFEVKELGDQFDYKGDLKSPVKVKELASKLLRSYQKDALRDKAPVISKELGELY